MRSVEEIEKAEATLIRILESVPPQCGTDSERVVEQMKQCVATLEWVLCNESPLVKILADYERLLADVDAGLTTAELREKHLPARARQRTASTTAETEFAKQITDFLHETMRDTLHQCVEQGADRKTSLLCWLGALVGMVGTCAAECQENRDLELVRAAMLEMHAVLRKHYPAVPEPATLLLSKAAEIN